MSEQASPSSSMQSHVPVTGLTTETLYALVSAQVDSVKALMEANDLRYSQRFDAQQKALQDALVGAKENVAAALAAAKEAVVKAEMAADKRFESVNEFRQTLSDQATTFMPRMESNARLDAMSEKIALLQSSKDNIAGHGAGVSGVWAMVFGAVGLLTGLLMLGLRLAGR